jgi:hypothetical protein
VQLAELTAVSARVATTRSRTEKVRALAEVHRVATPEELAIAQLGAAQPL